MIRDSQTTLEKKQKQLEDKKAEKEGLVVKQTVEKEIFHKNK
jgi:hypothetical protein